MAKNILIIGGGISGITSAVEAAETGYSVILVEKNPYLGGRVVQMNRYFPKLCPPTCGLEINLRRIKNSPNIKVLTLAGVENIEGNKGDYKVTIKIEPRYINERCTACGACAKVCLSERKDEFNLNMVSTKAIYLPHQQAFPYRYVIDSDACTKCGSCLESCKYGAIDLKMQAETRIVNVGSIIITTGWKPYDASKIDNLGFGRYKDVITNMMMERIASPNGPTEGKILRPSDQKEPKKIAFVQCAGSRDENHLAYCSAVCCLASLKQVTYLRESIPESEIFIFYIDIRTPGKYEDFYNKVASDSRVTFIKGKASKIEENGSELIVEAEDILSGTKRRENVSLVVLACGMQPVPPADITSDKNGFINPQKENGIYPAGVSKKPADVASSVQDATGAVLKAIQGIIS
ncbi:MAG: CoB--CoM heterodisulfide reductase iron-sulfur subunit A family protein [bacterium]|nr:CoB--CoM heterodisulfide reductase iron-sulfur subunit A family protein [bacterium]